MEIDLSLDVKRAPKYRTLISRFNEPNYSFIKKYFLKRRNLVLENLKLSGGKIILIIYSECQLGQIVYLHLKSEFEFLFLSKWKIKSHKNFIALLFARTEKAWVDEKLNNCYFVQYSFEKLFHLKAWSIILISTAQLFVTMQWLWLSW